MWYHIAIHTNLLNLGSPMYFMKAEYKPSVREENIVYNTYLIFGTDL